MNERLFQLVWSRQLFEADNLFSLNGVPVRVLNPGEINHGDGADFRNASIRYRDVILYGDIELHLYNRDWYSHHHHRDIRYNNVILHVTLYPDNATPVKLFDGTYADTIVLNNLVHPNFHEIIRQSLFDKKIPCHGYASAVNKGLIKQQLDISARQYFDKKVSDLTMLYEPVLEPSYAWLRMFGRAIFDGLGISRNRTQMVRLFDAVLNINISNLPLDQAIFQTFCLAGFEKATSEPVVLLHEWDKSSARPGNQPKNRIKQGIKIWKKIQEAGLSSFIHDKPNRVWENIFNESGTGKERQNILFYTVYLPSLYLLGNLFHAKTLKEASWNLWVKGNFRVPKSLAQPLIKAGLPPNIVSNHPGSVHQLKTFCREHRCGGCHIMKAIIQT